MIIFKTVRWQNLLSTGNIFTEVSLNRSKSTLVTGANGAGKSTMIEAIIFCLYNKPFREDLNKPQLLNTITGKKLITEVEFETNGKEYKIRRGIKPNLFEIYEDGTLLDIEAANGDYQGHLEKNILKMNFAAMTRTVILGKSNYTPFMKLKTPERRKVVEHFLDLEVFTTMNALLTKRINDNKSSIVDIEHNIDLAEQKIELATQHMNEVRQNNDEIISSKNVKIEELMDEAKEFGEVIKKTMAEVEELQAIITDNDKMVTRHEKIKEMDIVFKEKIKALSSEIEFLSNHDDCPTCKQGIKHEFKEDSLETHNRKVKEITEAREKLAQEWNKVNDRLGEIFFTQSKIGDLNDTINETNRNISYNNREIANLRLAIEELNNSNVKMVVDNNDLKAYNAELKKLKDFLKEANDDKKTLAVAQTLLKDTGIKSKIVKQYIPLINQFINKFLSDMNFACEFTLDENFNEKILSRNRDEFTFGSFSEGEKARIDLAIMFAWREVAKIKNSAATNLLLLDEVFDGSMDTDGNDCIMNILAGLTTDTNVFCITHSSADLLYDKFHSNLAFEQVSNFSRIKK